MRYLKVSGHAVTRIRERCPELPGDWAAVRQRITDEVLEAHAAGRISTRLPLFAVHPDANERSHGRRNGGERDCTIRFLWSRDQQRVYVVDVRGTLTTVVTVIRSADTPDAHEPVNPD